MRTREINKASFTFEFRIRHKAENRLVAIGHTTHCAIDEQYQAIAVSDHFRKVIAVFVFQFKTCRQILLFDFPCKHRKDSSAGAAYP